MGQHTQRLWNLSRLPLRAPTRLVQCGPQAAGKEKGRLVGYSRRQHRRPCNHSRLHVRASAMSIAWRFSMVCMCQVDGWVCAFGCVDVLT